jgi:hypothetical protein
LDEFTSDWHEILFSLKTHSLNKSNLHISNLVRSGLLVSQFIVSLVNFDSTVDLANEGIGRKESNGAGQQPE